MRWGAGLWGGGSREALAKGDIDVELRVRKWKEEVNIPHVFAVGVQEEYAPTCCTSMYRVWPKIDQAQKTK